jgi:hypothetical protein
MTAWIADRWKSPRFAALCLGLLSTPFAVAAIVSSSTPPYGNRDGVEPVSFGVALLVALGAVTAGSLAGGILGGSVVRKQPVLGLALALVVAWPVAIATLPLLPALLGWPYQAYVCTDGCTPWITAEVPLSGLTEYAGMLATALYGPGEVAGVLALIAIVLARSNHRIFASVFTIAAFVALNFWSIAATPGATTAMIALVAGSVIWAGPYLLADAAADGEPEAIPNSSSQAE